MQLPTGGSEGQPANCSIADSQLTMTYVILFTWHGVWSIQRMQVHTQEAQRANLQTALSQKSKIITNAILQPGTAFLGAYRVMQPKQEAQSGIPKHCTIAKIITADGYPFWIAAHLWSCNASHDSGLVKQWSKTGSMLTAPNLSNSS